MPPWRKYSASRGVSMRTRASKRDWLGALAHGGHGTVSGAGPPSAIASARPVDREELLAGEPERVGALPVGELQRQHAHPDQVRAVDALEALGDHGPHAEQLRALGRPVARGARAVLPAGEHDQVDALRA